MYELVVVWDAESKSVYTYETRDAAEDAMKGFYVAFGNQCWCCVRRKAV